MAFLMNWHQSMAAAGVREQQWNGTQSGNIRSIRCRGMPSVVELAGILKGDHIAGRDHNQSSTADGFSGSGMSA
jgi:hypothetical protein